MNKVFIKISALSISLMILATSCTKTGATGPNGTAGTNGANGTNGNNGAPGPNLSGNLQGIISLYDVSGAKMLSPTILKGDSVILTNSSSGMIMRTATDSTGKYMFSNISTGTYSLAVSKPNYGTIWAQGIQFAGGGNADRNYALSVIPITNIVAAASVDTIYAVVGAGNTPEKYIRVRGSVPVSASVITVITYISMSGNTSVNSMPGNFASYYTTTVSPGVSKFNFYIPTANFYDLNFASGSIVYFATYIIGGNTSASTYTDWNTGQPVFTALSSSPVTTSATVQ